MNSGIAFEKQDLPFEVDPNIAKPEVEISGEDVLMTFNIMGDKWPEEDEERTIRFKKCTVYRVGSPNDEGFFYANRTNETIYSKTNFPDLDFDNFYLVTGADWKDAILAHGGTIVNEDSLEDPKLQHYIFFMKDGTFECVAQGFEVDKG